jgi:hypothetical protein
MRFRYAISLRVAFLSLDSCWKKKTAVGLLLNVSKTLFRNRHKQKREDAQMSDRKFECYLKGDRLIVLEARYFPEAIYETRTYLEATGIKWAGVIGYEDDRFLGSMRITKTTARWVEDYPADGPYRPRNPLRIV